MRLYYWLYHYYCHYSGRGQLKLPAERLQFGHLQICAAASHCRPSAAVCFRQISRPGHSKFEVRTAGLELGRIVAIRNPRIANQRGGEFGQLAAPSGGTGAGETRLGPAKSGFSGQVSSRFGSPQSRGACCFWAEPQGACLRLRLHLLWPTRWALLRPGSWPAG